MAGHQMLCYQFILYYQVTYSILADAATMDTGIALVQLGWWRPAVCQNFPHHHHFTLICDTPLHSP